MARANLRSLIDLVDGAVGDLSVEQMFLNDLKKSIQDTDSKNKRTPSQTFKPSGMNCKRASYYEISGMERDEDATDCSLIGICESGTDRHERIQRAVQDMKDNGIDCEYLNVADYVKEHDLKCIDIVSQQGMETKLYHKLFNMSFLCDGIIKYKGEYYILEIKTESSFKFANRTGVNPEHYNQATAYSIAFGLNDVLFLYEDRNTCNKKTYILHVTDAMKRHLIQYMEEVTGAVKLKMVPKAVMDDKACRYCKYKTQCRKDG